MEKNMSAVARYEYNNELKFLRGMCFNNSAILLAGSFANGDVKLVTAKAVFNFAEALFNEAIERNYLDYGKVQDNRTIDKATGKVAGTPSSAGGGVPVTLTNEDVAQMELEENKDVVI